MNPPLALVYHVVRPLSRRWDLLEHALVVDPQVFARQLEHLAAGGFRTLTLREYAAALEGSRPPGRRVLLTFDDAIEGLDDCVTPLLQRHGYTAVVFAPWAHLGGLNTWDGQHPVLSRLRIMAAGRLQALAAGPWEIASHGGRHVDLRTVAPAVRRRELHESRQRLSDLAGQQVRALAYPFGHQDEGVRRDAAAAGFELGFVSSPYESGDCFRLPRRPVTDLDRGRLIDLRVSAVPWVYRLEDIARMPVRGTRLAHAAIHDHRGGERARRCG